MPGALFAELVGHLIELMGQTVDRIRQVPEGLLLATSDGFLYAFLEDPNQVSLSTIDRLVEQVRPSSRKLVVLTPGRLPLALAQAVLASSATLVEGPRFLELARGLGLGSYLGDSPRPEAAGARRPLLPSARQLDEILGRARTWTEWGVPSLGLRFYRQAAALKPEFLPARVGTGRALLSLGLYEEAKHEFDSVLETHPADMDARIGKAMVAGAAGHPEQEIAAYRSMLAEEPSRVEARAHLIAALVDVGHWGAAKEEIQTLLHQTPEDPRLRFLLSVALEKTGAAIAARRELERARDLGLLPERERSLSAQLGLPTPTIPERAGVTPMSLDAPPGRAPRAAKKPRASPPKPPKARGRRSPDRKSK